jgi:hypothetical protein
MPTEPPRHSDFCLAQKLYEASPVSGWSGPWHLLGDVQQQWWESFAALARAYVRMEHANDPATGHPGPQLRTARNTKQVTHAGNNG